MIAEYVSDDRVVVASALSNSVSAIMVKIENITGQAYEW